MEYLMPTYTYRNAETDEQFDKTMSISEMEQFESENPNLQRIYNPIALVDPAGIGVQKPPSDFSKYVLGKVKERHPRGSVEKRWHIPKEI
jgi:hypothetical protein